MAQEKLHAAPPRQALLALRARFADSDRAEDTAFFL
jgi:hypothetical protein